MPSFDLGYLAKVLTVGEYYSHLAHGKCFEHCDRLVPIVTEAAEARHAEDLVMEFDRRLVSLAHCGSVLKAPRDGVVHAVAT